MSDERVVVIDRSEATGAHAAERLETELIAWMTTVKSDGTPQVSPIWFLWDGSEFLLYSRDSPRIRNIDSHQRVSVNLDGDGLGSEIVVVEGTAAVDMSMPSAAENDAYLVKYKPVMDGYGWTPEWFAENYSVPVRITPSRYRHW